MKALIQRVTQAAVMIDGQVHNEIHEGCVVFLGVTHTDTTDQAVALAAKTAQLRIFADAQDRMNLSLQDIAGQVLVISQFTLYADTRKGNRPSFVDAAAPEQAEWLYHHYVESLQQWLPRQNVKTGRFRASMQITLTNNGPVTITLSTDAKATR